MKMGSESDLEANIEGDNFSFESLADICSPSLTEERNRRPPVWMRDYTTGEGLSEEDNEAHLAIHAATDPIHYEDALKSEKWSHAMDMEIEAINKKWHMGIDGITQGRKEGWSKMDL